MGEEGVSHSKKNKNDKWLKYRRTILCVLKEKKEKICFLKIEALLVDLRMKDRCVIYCLLGREFYFIFKIFFIVVKCVT